MMMDGVIYYKKTEFALTDRDPSCLNCGWIDYEYARKTLKTPRYTH